MRTAPFLAASFALAMGGCVSMPLSPADAATASLAPISRPELSLQPVPRRPSVGLNLAVFGPYAEGEVFEGGELDEIISGFGGPRPKLELANPARHDDLSDGRVHAQVAPDQIGPVHYHLSSSEVMNLGKASLDGALMVMPHSGLFERSVDQSKPAADPGYFIEQVVAAMKPGAVLVVVDQKPATDPEKAGGAKLPAGNKPVRVDEFEAQGLEFVGSLPASRDANAPGGNKPADPKEAAKPGRVFDLYRKPDPAPAKGPAPAPVVPG